MSSNKTIKKLFSCVSSLSRPLVVASLCFLIAGSCSTSTYAAERNINNSDLDSERTPLLLRENADIEQGTPRAKSGTEFKRDISELKGFISSLKDELQTILPHIKSVAENQISPTLPQCPDVQITDPQGAINGMQTILNAFEYVTEPDFRQDIETDMRSANKPVGTFEENQSYLINEGLAAANPDASLTSIINELLQQARTLQNQKTTLLQYIQLANAQRETQMHLFKTTLATLARAEEILRTADIVLIRAENRTPQNGNDAIHPVQKKVLYLTNLTTTLKRSLFISIPCALIAGGGAVYLFLHYYGR